MEPADISSSLEEMLRQVANNGWDDAELNKMLELLTQVDADLHRDAAGKCLIRVLTAKLPLSPGTAEALRRIIDHYSMDRLMDELAEALQVKGGQAGAAAMAAACQAVLALLGLPA
eukprot:scaffold57080_cov14-Prasinocladus_malaysianus.AAC.1